MDNCPTPQQLSPSIHNHHQYPSSSSNDNNYAILSSFLTFEDHVNGFTLPLTLTRDLIERGNLHMAIPSTIEKAKEAKTSGSAMISVPGVIRSEEWLQENGICLDNICQDQSNILQAGRCAFKTQYMPEGTIVAPLPLIHMDKEALKEMFKETNNGNDIEYEKDQLLLNYSYGHNKSPLVMFPYSPITNFVNHNFDHSAINAKSQ